MSVRADTKTLLFALTAGIEVEAAASSQTQPVTGLLATVSSPMTLNCSNLTPRATQYARSQHLCGLSSGGVVPDNTQTGNCGSNSLHMISAGGGKVKFLETAQSTLGNMVYVYHHVNWNNWSLGTSGSVGAGTGWNSSFWSNSDYASTNSGYITASQTGWVLLWWGATCDFIPTSDSITM
jgi:hypothetical protein